MRPASVMLFVSVVSCVLASRGTPAQQSSDPLDLLVSKIDTTITLRAWLKSHPGDKISLVPEVSGIDDPFCRAAVVRTQLMGRTLVRSALFYIPAPPNGEELPTDTATAALDLCELRTLVLASEEMAFPAAHALHDSLALLIDKRLGQRIEPIPLAAGGVPGAEDEKLWNGPGTKVVVGTAPTGKAPRAENAKFTTGKLLAVAYAPGSGAQDFDSWESRYRGQAAQRAADQQTRYRDIDSALVWAALPSVTADLKTVLVFLRSRVDDNLTELRPPQIDAALLRAINTIHDVAPSLPPPRRAAALLAGDVTLFATRATMSADSGTRISRALDSLGLWFEALAGPTGYRNTRAWLWQAYELDSTGRAGRAAFVELLRLNWPETGGCNTDEYAPIIQHGEAALKNGNANPFIHFQVGSAYKSIYDFANWTNDEYELPASVRAQAESSRLKGIEHFRAALESLPERPLRREAWTKAMRLIVHRTGEQPEIICFPD